MKKHLTSLLSFALVFLLLAQTAQAANTKCSHPFLDIEENFAEDAICFLYQQGVVEGHSSRNYLPENTVTRAEFLKMMMLTLTYSVSASSSNSFTDVEAGTWYYSYITFAKSKGFVKGYSDGSFRPNSPISRGEAVSLLIQVADIIEYGDRTDFTKFYDVSQDDWFASAVALATSHGIIEGYGDGSFRPNAYLNRAQAAAVLVRTWDTLY